VKTFKETMKQELGELRKMKDELELQAHLGKLEAKDALRRIERSLPDFEKGIDAAVEKTSTALRDAVKEAKKVLDGLKSRPN
jgi:hypothetical protein